MISPAGEFVSSTPGNYLKAYDPDHLDGRGYFETTAEPQRGEAVSHLAEVLTCWERQSAARPCRPDGTEPAAYSLYG